MMQEEEGIHSDVANKMYKIPFIIMKTVLDNLIGVKITCIPKE